MEGGRASDTIYHQSRDPNKTLSEEVDSGPPKPISLAGSNVRLWHITDISLECTLGSGQLGWWESDY